MRTVILDKREEVIANIRRCAAAGDFNAKVEVDDPQLTAQEKRALVERYLRQRPTVQFRAKRACALGVLETATRSVNRHTRVEGLEKIAGVTGGAIVTSNHFSPIDNTVVRHALRQAGRRRMAVVGREENLAMPSLFGFMMRYADVVPISGVDRAYMTGEFEGILRERLEGDGVVLIYPEQEMWFNYRPPRPGKRGAYHYASRLGVPVISCFVEIVDRDDLTAPDFVEVSYVMHILDPLFPDPAKSARENSVEMCARDYEQKRAAYERAYGRRLDYRFSPDDIAGWVPSEATARAVMGQAEGEPQPACA